MGAGATGCTPVSKTGGTKFESWALSFHPHPGGAAPTTGQESA